MPHAEADCFGYQRKFEQELEKVGEISREDFEKQFKPTGYLEKIGFNATDAKYWDLIATDTKAFNESQRANRRYGWRSLDCRMSAEERALFDKNGFVVLKNVMQDSFGTMYHRIYSDDLPVFVTVDSILHAWHCSFDVILEQIETSTLRPALVDILTGMLSTASKMNVGELKGELKQGVVDAEYFLLVALQLLSCKTPASKLGNDKRIAQTLEAIKSLGLQQFNLFGQDREIDFSQFKVRGHYEKTKELQTYFQAMMWCGRIDILVANDVRQLAASVVLLQLLVDANKMDAWSTFDQTIQSFIGVTDSMTFAQLHDILARNGVRSLQDLSDSAALESMLVKVAACQEGTQEINSSVMPSPFGPEQSRLPKSFTVMGQKFTLDSWATAKVVYDQVKWHGNKVERRRPTGLDVAFSVLNNNKVVPELMERISKTGHDYQHHLTALRNMVEYQRPEVWGQSIYNSWLAVLRSLSEPTTGEEYPDAMRTNAWAMKDSATQLASWAQLRHDTILYVKQSYGCYTCCEYPAGFVDPRPHVWESFINMVEQSRKILGAAKYDSTYHTQFLDDFGATLKQLKEIAEKETKKTPLSKEEEKFLKAIVSISGGGSGPPTYSGWYLQLFYKSNESGCDSDFIVTDVHSNPPDDSDSGSVLHEGLGQIRLMVVAANSGPDKAVYVGPVYSHYEFETTGLTRVSDSEWEKMVKKSELPPLPTWTRHYMA